MSVFAGMRNDALEEESKPMNEDAFNMSIRKFLKQVGVTSQREIEALARSGKVAGKVLKVSVVLTAAGTDLNHAVSGEIELP
jgi:hypothetical protein